MIFLDLKVIKYYIYLNNDIFLCYFQIYNEKKTEQKLIEWKKSKSRSPLLVNGARQVGKTYLLQEFGRKYYRNIVYVNLEANPAVARYFDDDINPKRIFQYLESSFQQKIIPNETLIVLDEIQSCERALTSLKYFAEETPDYHIARAGSLLGVAINREKYSYPVGKVHTVSLFPIDFEEFCSALNNESLLAMISEHYSTNTQFPEDLHIKALELYKKYLIIGGMPQAVYLYTETESMNGIPEIQNEILNAYIADMAKYANRTESVKIRAAYESLPNQLAKDNKKFQYKVIQRGASASQFGSSIDWLCYAGVVLKCQKIDQAVEPIAVYADLGSFKLYMADTGMLVMRSGISSQTILSNLDINNTFLGAVAENYVAQEFATKQYPLYYWESKSIAEIDFVLQKDNLIIPVEVKSGTRTRSRSLSEFVKKYRPDYSIRISARNFGFENNIKSVPLYSVYNI